MPLAASTFTKRRGLCKDRSAPPTTRGSPANRTHGSEGLACIAFLPRHLTLSCLSIKSSLTLSKRGAVRDDLHHSFPQTNPWRTVVRVACAPGVGGDLVDALTRAAWARAGWMSEAWGKELLHVLTTQQVELFGNEQMEQKLSALETWCPSPDARRALDIAFAEVMSGQAAGDLKDRVARAALEASAEDGIEGAVAWVADIHHDTQVRQLRAALLAALSKCEFRHPPAPKVRTRKPTVEQSLNTALSLQGV